MIIEDAEQLCAKLVKFTALQYFIQSVQFHLSNGKLSYFSHFHYTNWADMWPQLYVLSLVIQTDQELKIFHLAFPIKLHD